MRVYATQSTHKTLTALRQGSMIHVHDQDFEHHVRNAFNEAYMTHTSTSPNYQILATLGRRAHGKWNWKDMNWWRKSIALGDDAPRADHSDPLLRKYFRVLAPEGHDSGSNYRPSGIECYYDSDLAGAAWIWPRKRTNSCSTQRA